MNNRISLQQFKVLFFAQTLFALLLAAPGVAFADTDTDTATSSEASSAATNTANIGIKDTNYPIPSGAYFVSPNGSNSNSGKSLNSPWTVAKAINSAPSGSTIVFRGGTYRDVNNIMLRKKLTLQPYPHEKVWLKGSQVVTGWDADGDIWRKDGWNYSFPQNVGNEYLDKRYPLAGYRDMVYVNGVSFQQVKGKAQVAAGKFYVDSTNNRLYIGSNPTGKTVEATTLNEAFGIWKSKSNDPSNTVVRGLGFAHYADRGLTVGAPYVKLENNTFVWNGEHGARTMVSNSHGIVRGNTFSYNARVGFRADNADDMLLEDNTFSYNNVERFSTGWDGAGVKFTWTDRLLARRNIMERNFAAGFWVDISSTDITIVNNISRYNNSGIFFEISHGAIIGANVVHNNSYAGILVSNASDTRVYNNSIANNGINIRLKDTTRNNTNAKEKAAGITWIARDNVFKNNILSNGGSASFDSSNCDTKEQTSKTISAADYNAYYRKSSSKPKYLFKWSLGANKCAVWYTSFTAFDKATDFEDNALMIDNVATNPFFVDEANGNYKLKPGSPAIGHGQALPADIAKAIGVKSGVPIDLGAIQSKAVLVE